MYGVVHTSWRPPKYIREKSAEERVRIREKYHIVVEGEDIPPPIESFTVSSNHLICCLPKMDSVVGHEDTEQYNTTSEEE